MTAESVIGPGAVVEVEYEDGGIETVSIAQHRDAATGSISRDTPLARALQGAVENETREFVVAGQWQHVRVRRIVTPVNQPPAKVVLQNFGSTESDTPLQLEARIGPLDLFQFLALSPRALKLYIELSWFAAQAGNPFPITTTNLCFGKGMTSQTTITQALKELIAHQLIAYEATPTGSTVTVLPAPSVAPVSVIDGYTDTLRKRIETWQARIAEASKELRRWEGRPEPESPPR